MIPLNKVTKKIIYFDILCQMQKKYYGYIANIAHFQEITDKLKRILKYLHDVPLFCIPLPYFCNVTIMKQGNGDHQNRSTRAGNDSLS